ncbi:hypothetical protein [Amycolatopsis suaedae]|uniref:hypothetical protein n=1 Tax=Amycolatopsis suaedae TaxID=2510978 RepID=UPI0013EF0AF3|nr:hypothetical protein [Amycolatopsis suaedae]
MSRFAKITVVAATCAGLVMAPGAAQAEVAPTALGSVGEVDVTLDGTVSEVAPIAPCTLGATESNRTSGVTEGDTKYGAGETSCVTMPGGFARAEVKGSRFETKVLRRFGGPTIKVRTYLARCDTTKTGAAGYVELSGLSGVSVPSSIPANHKITVPAPDGGKPLAEVMVNELIAPTPPDGSLRTNLMRITLFPQGGPASGEIVVGSAACDPFGG